MEVFRLVAGITMIIVGPAVTLWSISALWKWLARVIGGYDMAVLAIAGENNIDPAIVARVMKKNRGVWPSGFIATQRTEYLQDKEATPHKWLTRALPKLLNDIMQKDGSILWYPMK